MNVLAVISQLLEIVVALALAPAIGALAVAVLVLAMARPYLPSRSNIGWVVILGGVLLAAVVSAVVWYLERESAWPYESVVILTIVALNTALSLIQEGRAEKALSALRASLLMETGLAVVVVLAVAATLRLRLALLPDVDVRLVTRLAHSRAQALLVQGISFTFQHLQQIVDLAAQHRRAQVHEVGVQHIAQAVVVDAQVLPRVPQLLDHAAAGVHLAGLVQERGQQALERCRHRTWFLAPHIVADRMISSGRKPASRISSSSSM